MFCRWGRKVTTLRRHLHWRRHERHQRRRQCCAKNAIGAVWRINKEVVWLRCCAELNHWREHLSANFYIHGNKMTITKSANLLHQLITIGSIWLLISHLGVGAALDLGKGMIWFFFHLLHSFYFTTNVIPFVSFAHAKKIEVFFFFEISIKGKRWVSIHAQDDWHFVSISNISLNQRLSED